MTSRHDRGKRSLNTQGARLSPTTTRAKRLPGQPRRESPLSRQKEQPDYEAQAQAFWKGIADAATEGLTRIPPEHPEYRLMQNVCRDSRLAADLPSGACVRLEIVQD